MNKQPIEKQTLDPNGVVEIHHIFRTIQGEGPFAGTPAVFVRMSGCNLQCPLCDTDYTSQRNFMSPGQIVDKVREVKGSSQLKLVVITGGEPFRQNIEPFVHELLENGFEVQLETNGTLWVPNLPTSDEHFSIVCSPKTGKLNPILAHYITAFKYVLHADYVDPEDGLPTYVLNHGIPQVYGAKPQAIHSFIRVARPPEDIFGCYDMGGSIYVQPVDPGTDNRRHEKAAIDSCIKFGYIFCLQVQKFIGLE